MAHRRSIGAMRNKRIAPKFSTASSWKRRPYQGQHPRPQLFQVCTCFKYACGTPCSSKVSDNALYPIWSKTFRKSRRAHHIGTDHSVDFEHHFRIIGNFCRLKGLPSWEVAAMDQDLWSSMLPEFLHFLYMKLFHISPVPETGCPMGHTGLTIDHWPLTIDHKNWWVGVASMQHVNATTTWGQIFDNFCTCKTSLAFNMHWLQEKVSTTHQGALSMWKLHFSILYNSFYLLSFNFTATHDTHQNPTSSKISHATNVINKWHEARFSIFCLRERLDVKLMELCGFLTLIFFALMLLFTFPTTSSPAPKLFIRFVVSLGKET